MKHRSITSRAKRMSFRRWLSDPDVKSSILAVVVAGGTIVYFVLYHFGRRILE